MGRLDGEGFTNSFGESKWKFTNGSLVVERGKKQNTLDECPKTLITYPGFSVFMFSFAFKELGFCYFANI